MAIERCEGTWKGDNWIHVMCDREDPHPAHDIDTNDGKPHPFDRYDPDEDDPEHRA